MFAINSSDYSIYSCQIPNYLKSKPNFDYHPVYTNLTIQERKESLETLGIEKSTIDFWDNYPKMNSNFQTELLIQKIGSMETGFRFFYDTLLIGAEETNRLFTMAPILFIAKLRQGTTPPYLEALLDFTPIDQTTIHWFLPLIEKTNIQQRLVKEAADLVVIHLLKLRKSGIQNLLEFENLEKRILFWGKMFFKLHQTPEVKSLAASMQSAGFEKNFDLLILSPKFFSWCVNGGCFLTEQQLDLILCLLQEGKKEILQWLITTPPFIHFGVNHFSDFILTLKNEDALRRVFFENLIDRYNPALLINHPAILSYIEKDMNLTKLVVFKCFDCPGWSWENSVSKPLLTHYIKSLTLPQLHTVLFRRDYLGKVATFKYFVKSQIPKNLDAYKMLSLNSLITHQPASWWVEFSSILRSDLEENFSKKYLQQPFILEIIKKCRIDTKIELFKNVPHSLAFLLLASFHFNERIKLSNLIEAHILPSNQMVSIALFAPVLMILKGLSPTYDEKQRVHLRIEYPAIYNWICQDLRKGLYW
ncbi:MAG: hypothetical protein KGQ54_03505 [Verrucomicrobia bacterium]|nr:hypothetical protein [Verrucomicrobiota bacterium]NDE62964.1 hypothetical protein [Chlamydiota bacterium]